MGFFSGRRPRHLGIVDGRFAPGSWKPNYVCSQAEPSDKKHYVKAFEFEAGDDPLDIWEALVEAIKAIPRATIVTETRTYLHAEIASKRFGFVDDLEIYLPPPMSCIHVRSAARVGIRDFGVNRSRVDFLRNTIKK
jgi:uncharacterized protein (DUF1499 family)